MNKVLDILVWLFEDTKVTRLFAIGAWLLFIVEVMKLVK